MKKRGQLISGDEAVPARTQHPHPCLDCPFARIALPGWLGALTAEEWLRVAHGESTAECHTLSGARCAGMAIYRANVGKLPRDPSELRLPADREVCFAGPMEFQAHHARKGPIERFRRGMHRRTADRSIDRLEELDE